VSTVTGSAAGGAWNTNGAWLLGVQPTAADDVVMVGATGAINIPASTTAVCRSLDCTGFASSLTFAATTSVLSIGDASGGKCLFVNTMTLPLTGLGTINFLGSTASTTYALTTAGLVMPNLTVNAGASTTIQFADAVVATGAIVKLTAGKVDFNSKAVTCSTWTYTAGTVTTGTQTLTCSGAGITFAGGGQSYSSVVLSGSGTATTTGTGNTFVNLTRTGTAIQTDAITFSGNPTISNTLTLTGQSVTNRLLVQSSVVGTSRTITAAAIVLTNCDFQDFTGAGLAANAAWTGTSMGDCQGNFNITTDTPATQTYTDTGSHSDNWSTLARWTSRVPLPQDNVLVPLGSTGTITADMPRLGKSIDFTGFTGTCNIASIATVNFGSLTLASGMTLTQSTGFQMQARSAVTLTSATKQFSQNFTVSTVGGSVTFQDNFSTGAVFTCRIGTLNANGFTVTCSAFDCQAVVSPACVINMGGGQWSLTGTAAAGVWTADANVTINAQGSTIVIANASANTRTFAGGGKTYGTLTYTVAGSTGQLTITGSNTFGTINFSDATNARTLQFTSGTTNTFTTFNVVGTSGKKMTVSAVTPASAATLAGPNWWIGVNSNIVSGCSGLSTIASTGTMDYLTAQDIIGNTTSVAAGLASGVGQAFDIAASLQSRAGLASGVGQAFDVRVNLQPNAGLASGVGQAFDVRVNLQPNAGLASGVGQAFDVRVNLQPNAGLASGIGQAFDATVFDFGEAPNDVLYGAVFVAAWLSFARFPS
jgi:hypothetical protein